MRCGRCVDVCPLGLVPTRIALASRKGDWDLAQRYHIKVCMECGCCAWVCPAQLPLVQLIRAGKAEGANRYAENFDWYKTKQKRVIRDWDMPDYSW